MKTEHTEEEVIDSVTDGTEGGDPEVNQEPPEPEPERDEDGLIDRSLKEGVVQTVGGPVDVADVKKRFKSPQVRGSKNMAFIDNPPKAKVEKKDNANPPKKKLTNNDKRVGKSGGTRVEVGTGKKAGTEKPTTPARKRPSSTVAHPVKKTGTPDSKPKSTAARPNCLCGCGKPPAGKKSKYLPGHDAIHHSAIKKAAAEKGKKK